MRCILGKTKDLVEEGLGWGLEGGLFQKQGLGAKSGRVLWKVEGSGESPGGGWGG